MKKVKLLPRGSILRVFTTCYKMKNFFTTWFNLRNFEYNIFPHRSAALNIQACWETMAGRPLSLRLPEVSFNSPIIAESRDDFPEPKIKILLMWIFGYCILPLKTERHTLKYSESRNFYYCPSVRKCKL